MRMTRTLSAFAAAATLLAQPLAAGAQTLTRDRVAPGAPPAPGGAFPDAGFQYAYSFRAGGFAAGSGDADAVLGAGGACRVGEGCQTSAPRNYLPGASSYLFGLAFGGSFFGNPTLAVSGLGDGESTELALTGYTPAGPLNAFYLYLNPPAGATLTVGDLILFGAPPSGSAGFGTTAAGATYAFFRADGDLRDAILAFDLEVGGTAGAPTVDIYVGTMPAASTVPEPTTTVLTAAGLAALIAVVRRGRARA